MYVRAFNISNKFLLYDEPKPGLEPGTYSLRMNCSTN